MNDDGACNFTREQRADLIQRTLTELEEHVDAKAHLYFPTSQHPNGIMRRVGAIGAANMKSARLELDRRWSLLRDMNPK